MKKGWIALDIDGTLVDGMHPVPEPVVRYLDKLHTSGWKILFLTGRHLFIAEHALQPVNFPYYLGIQHGADILEMPTRKSVDQRYLESEILHHVERAYRGEEEDCLIHSGFAKGDFCYYRAERFSPLYLNYFNMLQTHSINPWKKIDSFQELHGQKFPCICCVGNEKTVRKVAAKLREIPGFEVIVIRDAAMDRDRFMAFVTDHEATKGKALHRILKTAGGTKGQRIIAAGDDHNDLSMLREADVRIVMEIAPKEILAEADIVAKSAAQMGILPALAEATGEPI